ncbi:hypothetical protein [Arthrobacter sp. ISL-65]|uniref:hypothetical protein n=1 Tax=Arthrobacter sp. ISL-65 TaxID=2819112 RepID=UPI001BE5D99A|nr:hypothetical protein [Arthrobacter sp. ISL-65]MBT2550844.1 hypothetical protein [Arthrobacter sp. ISL-65]
MEVAKEPRFGGLDPAHDGGIVPVAGSIGSNLFDGAFDACMPFGVASSFMRH